MMPIVKNASGAVIATAAAMIFAAAPFAASSADEAKVERTVQAAPLQSTSASTTYHRVTVDGVRLFYREAGPSGAPAIVLLHGFPSSSREFGSLIPLLAGRFHLVAPDFPGFGHSVVLLSL